MSENIGTENYTTKETETETESEINKYHKRMYRLKLAEYISAALLLLCIFLPLVLIVFFQIDADLREYKEAAELVSTFTSIILGFVAMTVSLIGMVLSFHNTRQTEDSNLNTTKEFTKLDGSVASLKELERDLGSNIEKITEKIYGLEKQMGTMDRMERKVDVMYSELNYLSSNVRIMVDKISNSKLAPVDELPSVPKEPDDDNYDG